MSQEVQRNDAEAIAHIAQIHLKRNRKTNDKKER